MAVAAPVNRPRPNVQVFDSMTLPDIGGLFKNDTNRCIAFCRQHGMLAVQMICSNCGSPCTEQNNVRKIDGKVWRCTRRACKRKHNIRKGSFFGESKLELWQILGLTQVWAMGAGSSRGLSVNDTKHQLNIGCAETVVDWNQFCRDICVSYFLNNPQQLGGQGQIVEIDESLFARRKYNRGHLVPNQWVMGGYEPQTKKGFLVQVPRRDAPTLLPIINQWVLPGTTVWSDMWAAYNSLAAQGFQHGTVNHQLNFVDPNTGVTTNHVEAMWSAAKGKFKSMRGPTNRAVIPDYLSEFMWTQRFRDHKYFHIWDQIVTLYPV